MQVTFNLDRVEAPMLLLGIRVNTNANDFALIEAMSLMKFDGENRVLLGDVITVG